MLLTCSQSVLKPNLHQFKAIVCWKWSRNVSH